MNREILNKLFSFTFIFIYVDILNRNFFQKVEIPWFIYAYDLVMSLINTLRGRVYSKGM